MAIPTILIVDDEQDFRENLTEFLTGKGYRIFQAPDGKTALKIAKSEIIDVALLDIQMPGMDGITLLSKLKKQDSSLEAIIITGEGGVESAVEAMRMGAFHYLTKPVRLKELDMLLLRALEKNRMGQENEKFKEEQKRFFTKAAPEIIAQSKLMQEVIVQAGMVAQSDMPILIEGETGTGKEVVAKFIHRNSKRRDGKFVVINCGALSENLMDSELFGHERGAFTGATEKQLGMIEISEWGTLFLDEIGDIPEAAQIRLLRFLELGMVRRIGSTKERKIDTRIIAATHRDLIENVKKEKFREDLFHRLRVFPLQIAPLRERRADILPLAMVYLNKLEYPDAVTSLSSSAEEQLLNYAWPGNVRELGHTIERASMMAQLTRSTTINPEHLALMPTSGGDSILVPLREAEQRHIKQVLNHFDGNRQKSAEILGISERHLYRLIRQEGENSVSQ